MKLFKAIFTLSALLVITGLQARQMYIGNLNFEDKFRQSGVVKGDTVGATVFVSSEDLSDKIGAELKRVSFYYNSTTAPKYLKLFVSSSLDSINIFSKDIETSTIIKGWNELELDSAYVISGDSLYLGYYLLGASTSSAVANNSSVQSFIKKGSTEDWVSTKGIAVYGTIYGDSLPAHDIVLTSDLNDIDVEVAKSFNVAFAVENVAADTIKTIEIECDYGDGKKENKIIDTNIPYLSSDSIVYEGIVLDTTGLFNLTFTVLKLNGEDDLTPENNTHTIKVNVIERIVKRKLLFEVFSTENCTACPKGHDIIESSIAYTTSPS